MTYSTIVIARDDVFKRKPPHLWSHKLLGGNFSYTTRIQDEQEVTIDGPYRYVQHPEYTALLLIGVSLFLITANFPPAPSHQRLSRIGEQ